MKLSLAFIWTKKRHIGIACSFNSVAILWMMNKQPTISFRGIEIEYIVFAQETFEYIKREFVFI